MKNLLLSSAVGIVLVVAAVLIGVHGVLQVIPIEETEQETAETYPAEAQAVTEPETAAIPATPATIAEETKEETGHGETQAPDKASSAPLPVSGKAAMTTMFWVGEGATSENGFISNAPSYWDEAWQEHFGGIDSPECRDGYYPCDFVPRENPFYVALPYGEYGVDGELKAEAKNLLPLKNRWVKVTYKGTTCYGQWEDVGPNNENDFVYVFGDAEKPTNTFGAKAGLDISPALWSCLGMEENDVTRWEFVSASAVPTGPWKAIVTK